MDRSDVFLSYRRADVDFTKKLYSALKETGRELWVDWEDIPPGVEGFSDEIQRGIEGTHTFVCVLSPSYLESEYCLMELREALKLKKRVVPIVLKKFDPLPPPEGIGHINWVYFTPHAGQKNKFEESFPKVIEALEADYEYVREHTRLLLRAIDWDKGQRGKSYVLKDAEIEKAERWQVAAIAKNPTPTELHGEYILTSRTIQRQQQRRFTAIIGILLGFAVLAAIFAGFQWNSAVRSEATAVAAKNDALTQKAIADNQRATAQAAESTAVAAKEEAENQRKIAEEEAQNALISGLAAQSQLIRRRQLGILVALEAYNASKKKGEVSPAVQTSLRSALVDFGGVPVQSYKSSPSSILFSPDDRWLISSTYQGMVQVSDMTQGLNSQPITLVDKGLFNLIVSPDSQWLAGIYFDSESEKNEIRLWSLNDLASDSQIIDLPEDAAPLMALAFSGTKSKQYWLAAGLEDGSIYTWNVANLPQAEPVLLYQEKFKRSADRIAFSPDGRWLAVAFNHQANPTQTIISPILLIWNMQNPSGDPLTIDLIQVPADNLLFSKSGKWLAGTSYDKLRLWNMDTVSANPLANAFDVGVGDVAFSPDERWVGITSGVEAQVWNLSNFSNIKLPGYKDIVLTISFSPDSRWLATGDYDGQIRFWNTADFSNTNTPVAESQARIYKGFDVIVNSVEFNSDGSQLAAAGDQQVRVWNFPAPISAPVKIADRGISPTVLKSALLIQTGETDMFAMDLNGDDPIVILKTTQKNPILLSPSPDENYLAVTSNKQIQVWDLRNPGKPLFENERQDGQFVSPIFTADSRWFVYAAYNQIFALDLQKAQTPIVLSGNRTVSPISNLYTVNHWLISQSSSEILAWDTTNGLSKPVSLSDAAGSTSVFFFDSWLIVQKLGGLSAWKIADFSAAPIIVKNEFLYDVVHDRWLITTTADGNTYALWDLSKPATPVAEIGNWYAFSESKNWFYYYDGESVLQLLDLTKPNPQVVSLESSPDANVAFSPDDQWLATTSKEGDSILLYELTNGMKRHRFPGINPLLFSPDGHWLLFKDADGKTALYDLQNNEPFPVTYPSADGFQSSPDKRWLVGTLEENNGTNSLLIDLQDPEKFYTLGGHTDVVIGRYFTPDQHSLLTYGYDGMIRIWDLENPAADPVVLSHGDGEVIFGVNFSENGKWLISNTSQNIYIWQWKFDDVTNLACRLAGRNLTVDEWEKYIGAMDYHKTCDQWP